MNDEEYVPRSFWARHKKLILVMVVVYGTIVLVLIALAWGPQNNPFKYQIF